MVRRSQSLLDDVLTSVWRGTIAMLIGIAPAEYPLVMIGFRLVESLSHTNVRVSLGWIGKLCSSGRNITGCTMRSSTRGHHSTARWGVIAGDIAGLGCACSGPGGRPVFPATGVAAWPRTRVSCGYVRHQLEGFRRFGAVVARWFDRRRPALLPGSAKKRQSPAEDAA